MKEDKGKKSTSPQISFLWVKKIEEFSEGIEKVGGKKGVLYSENPPLRRSACFARA